MYDPRIGGQAVRIDELRLYQTALEPPRTNYFSIYSISSGSGTVWADASRFPYGPRCVVFFVPYQHIRFVPDRPGHIELIQFHANFLCVETFHSEVGCSGILFNDPYGIPIVPFDEAAFHEVTELLARLRREFTDKALAYEEVMLAQLKVLLILAARIKSPAADACLPASFDPRHPVLADLRDQIEKHYRTLHSPADYARLLHVSAKTLGRIVREQLGTTLTELIRNRVLIHAKWQLLHTLRPVKEIAREVGFDDELYFSRLFKRATGRSPTAFRTFETEIRGGSNLSMSSSPAPILNHSRVADTSVEVAEERVAKPAKGRAKSQRRSKHGRAKAI